MGEVRILAYFINLLASRVHTHDVIASITAGSSLLVSELPRRA